MRARSRLPCAVVASAACTAPQPSCPSTTKSGVCRCTAAYCIDAHHFRRDHVAGDAHDEQLAEARVEHQFRRHARVAAAEDGGVRALALGEIGEHFLLHGGEARRRRDEALVAATRRASASSAVIVPFVPQRAIERVEASSNLRQGASAARARAAIRRSPASRVRWRARGPPEWGRAP